MSNVLLDYFFNISVLTPTPAANTGFLKQLCLIVKPKNGVAAGSITECINMSQVNDLTDNNEAEQAFKGGLNRVFILVADDLDLGGFLEGNLSDFYTMVISSDFTDADVLGEGEGEVIDSPAIKASIKVQDILYTAKEAGISGNDLSITYEDVLLKEAKASLVVQDLTFTSKLVGVLGNAISVVYTDGNTAGQATASVANDDEITVSIETGVTDADTIKAAIELNSDSNALVSCEVSGSGASAQDEYMSPVLLTGGIDAEDGKADGTAIVRVESGTKIIVDIDTGRTLASTVGTAVNNHSTANLLVSALVDSGDESDIQEAQGITSLTGGVDAVMADANATGLEVGSFAGVVAYSSQDRAQAKAFALAEKRCGFYASNSTKAKNMVYAFASILSNMLNWNNQQYITMPYSDGIDSDGLASSLFDDKISFVLSDPDTYGNRLSLFCAGGKAIVAPYVIENLKIDSQGRGLQWVSANQPSYTLKNAALLESRLQEDVVNLYIDKGWLDSGSIAITLEQDDFIASSTINVPTPRAMWRIFGEIRQS